VKAEPDAMGALTLHVFGPLADSFEHQKLRWLREVDAGTARRTRTRRLKKDDENRERRKHVSRVSETRSGRTELLVAQHSCRALGRRQRKKVAHKMKSRSAATMVTLTVPVLFTHQSLGSRIRRVISTSGYWRRSLICGTRSGPS
jgi:hypothetical protein